MRIVKTYDILNGRLFKMSRPIAKAWADIRAAIVLTDWPHGSGSFTIYPVRHANGVLPIKRPFVAELLRRGWTTECLPQNPSEVLSCGELDAMLPTVRGPVGVEWETGNVSSSHRAINKLLLTSQIGGLHAGVLILPSRKLYNYVTDRIGNIDELLPYFRLWKSTTGAAGALRIVVVEHDAESLAVAPIPKGLDGMSLQRRRGNSASGHVSRRSRRNRRSRGDANRRSQGGQ